MTTQITIEGLIKECKGKKGWLENINGLYRFTLSNSAANNATIKSVQQDFVTFKHTEKNNSEIYIPINLIVIKKEE